LKYLSKINIDDSESLKALQEICGEGKE